MMETVTLVVVGALALCGAIVVLLGAIGLFRERDAYCRLAYLGTVASFGLPILVTASYLESLLSDGFSVYGLIRFVLTVGALLIVASEGSNMIARAAYLSGSPAHDSTDPQDLAE